MGHRDDGSEVRLSQSDVHVGLPEDEGEVVTAANLTIHAETHIRPLTDRSNEAFAFASAMSDVAAHEEVMEEPTAPGVIATPVS